MQNEVDCSPSSPLHPELAPSDFHIFASVKEALRGRHFVEDDQLQHSLLQDFRHFSQEFDATGILPFMKRVKTLLIMKNNLWKNNLRFVNNLQVVCSFLLVTEVTVYEKWEAIFLDCRRIYTDL
jgi:hypothetical protein